MVEEQTRGYQEGYPIGFRFGLEGGRVPELEDGESLKYTTGVFPPVPTGGSYGRFRLGFRTGFLAGYIDGRQIADPECVWSEEEVRLPAVWARWQKDCSERHSDEWTRITEQEGQAWVEYADSRADLMADQGAG